jgi:hypothetical protein
MNPPRPGCAGRAAGRWPARSGAGTSGGWSPCSSSTSSFTGIAERLDPEDLKGVQAPYFQRVRAELQRYGGHVEK